MVVVKIPRQGMRFMRRNGVTVRVDLPQGSDVNVMAGSADVDINEPVRSVRLSELFTAPDRALVVQHVMYGKLQSTPCPMCTMWVDGLNAAVRHVQQNADYVVAAAADPPALRAHARARGWDSVRLLSCGDNSFQYDFGAEDEAGSQDSSISVFTLDPGGSPRHFYTCHPQMSDDVFERGIDLLSPVWHLLDLTPTGRGEWYAELEY